MIEEEIGSVIVTLRDNEEWLSDRQQGLAYILSLLHPKEKVKKKQSREEKGIVAEKITNKLPFF